MMSMMEQFLYEIEAYASALGVPPTTVLYRAKVGCGSTWRSWRDGKATPTLMTADRVKAYMQSHPAAEVSE